MSAAVEPIPMEKEYEKNPDILPKDIKMLREWLETQPHLPEKYITDLDIMLVYFCCDKSFEVSKQLLDVHFTLLTQITSVLKFREVNKTTYTVLNTILLAPLPTPTLNGFRAVYTRLLDGNLKNYMFTEITRCFYMLIDLLQYEHGTIPGAVIVVDMDMVGLGHLAKMELGVLRDMQQFNQEGILLKLKEIHFINAPKFVDKLMMMIRPFTNKSLMDLIMIHERGSDSLYKYVSKDSLPKESGGKYKDYLTLRDEVIRYFEDNKEYFKKENLRRVNESLRPNIKKAFHDIQGSFKMLEID